MRYVLAKNVATGAVRKIPCATTASDGLFVLGGTISLINYAASPPAAADFLVTFAAGEKRQFLIAGDTGLLTG